MKSPLISILTPSYNQGAFIEQTITSVLRQNDPRLEHIVIDGGSSDQTVSILKRYPHLQWVSEKDEGQADSLNKGLAMATGDIVGWINSDDFYAPCVLPLVRKTFEDPVVGWLIGDVVNYYHASAAERVITSSEVTYESLSRDPDIVRQQGAFFRADLLRRAGGWDPALYMVMDLDLWFRLARLQTPRMVHTNTAYWRIHSEQKSGLARQGLQTREIDSVLRRNGVSSTNRFRLRAKKQYWRLKGTVKASLQSVGMIEAVEA